ncbi:MAG: aminotransferase class I/II-fold pyridoxal phosphate-dependent enzyme [Clostridia bacterium]|nr:aminotransferase class I/II-fold pyridoxal phosphate-dependent enzyme [Clostridia bacterium]
MDYSQIEQNQLINLLKEEQKLFKRLQKSDKPVDMTRGRPESAQLDIAMPMLSRAGEYDYCEDGIDNRNYGGLQGIKPARELFADLIDCKVDEVIVADGSSLDLMYTVLQFAMQFGVLGSTPWNQLKKVKFICLTPGYDRHFAICEHFGIEMIGVRLRDDGPDMDIIESLVRDDESVKGIWCVPKYSNPSGITYSDKAVERLATMKTAAKDFRIFWDNAYLVHDLYEKGDKLKNIFDVARRAGTLDRVYAFTSTSKITFAGSGLAAFASSVDNIDAITHELFFKTIGPNKINQVMHVNFLKDVDNIKEIMKMHSEILRPKFELFEKKMSEEFAEDDYVHWSRPRGGYFISLDVKNCAKRVVELSAEAGVKLTPAGSSFPYKMDDLDENIRIAPSVPTIEEMDHAVDVIISAVKQARMERVLLKEYGIKEVE